MTDSIRQYILSIAVAALVCSIVKSLVGKNTGHGKVVDLICGTFLAVTLLSPWIHWNIQDVAIHTDEIQSNARNITAQAQSATEVQLRTIIKEEAEAYILDKASLMNADVQVEIQLDQDEPIPVGAVITGSISPYNKTALSRYMEDALAITEEAQIWNSDQ